MDATPGRIRASVPAVARSGKFLVGVGAMAVAPVVAGILAYRATGAEGRGELAAYVVTATIASILAARGVDAAVLSPRASEAGPATLSAYINRRLISIAVLEAPVAAAVASVLVGGLDAAGVFATWLLAVAASDYTMSKALGVRTGATDVVLSADVGLASVIVGSSLVVYLVDGDASLFALALALSFAAVSVVLRAALPSRRGLTWSRRSTPASDIESRARPLFVSKGLIVVAFRLDRLLLVALVGLSGAGIYAAAIPFAEIVALAPLHLAQMSTVELSQDPGTSWWRTTPAVLGMAISATLAVLVVAFARPILELAYGESGSEFVRTVRVLAVASFVSGLWRLVESGLISAGRSRATVPGAASAAVVVVVLTWALADALQSTAAAVASLAGYLAALVISLVLLDRGPPTAPLAT